ncbi:hypothetical protein [Endozoicomonas sp. SESOKO1]|uniref:hypothetical protein n=1 Tax=Endozoicomonas sp. SESOKO1 TaxID=2828742 RepID=UPI002148A7CC|nr:hypothetical protein [Endozoicomonas sp. SESOKO1]
MKTELIETLKDFTNSGSKLLQEMTSSNPLTYDPWSTYEAVSDMQAQFNIIMLPDVYESNRLETLKAQVVLKELELECLKVVLLQESYKNEQKV